MKLPITLDTNTMDTLDLFCELTNLPYGALIDRFVSAHTAAAHELMALADAHPELREQAANLIISFGPEPLEEGIKQIAPPGYQTLCQRIEREMVGGIGAARTTH
jgi:hypothetical protein